MKTVLATLSITIFLACQICYAKGMDPNLVDNCKTYIPGIYEQIGLDAGNVIQKSKIVCERQYDLTNAALLKYGGKSKEILCRNPKGIVQQSYNKFNNLLRSGLKDQEYMSAFLVGIGTMPAINSYMIEICALDKNTTDRLEIETDTLIVQFFSNFSEKFYSVAEKFK